MKNEIHFRHVFEVTIDEKRDTWTHTVNSHDEDNGEVFSFYWLGLEEAKNKLVADQGKYLSFGNGHFIHQDDILTSYQNEELKITGKNANFSKYFNFKRIAAHYFKVPSGYRTSEPHAESLEEEFVYILKGEIDLWFNGEIKPMKTGDCIGFPAGTGVGHCFINNSEDECELFISGERTKADNQYHFHLAPELKEECGDRWWDAMPKQKLGKHDGLPGSFSQSLINDKIEVFNGMSNFTDKSFSYPGDTETFVNTVDLSRRFGLKRVAICIDRIPVGKRSSWPHAHSEEEEFAYILEGKPIVCLDEECVEAAPSIGIDFKAGSGVAHTLLNKTQEYIYYIMVGECDLKEDKIFYPEHPLRNQEMMERGLYWDFNKKLNL